MIYFIYSEVVRSRYNYPEIGCSYKDFDQIGFLLKACADYIFKFEGVNTIYIKDRSHNNYQYTEVERLILKLKAASI